jgi:hypothetical protein
MPDSTHNFAPKKNSTHVSESSGTPNFTRRYSPSALFLESLPAWPVTLTRARLGSTIDGKRKSPATS